MAAFGSGAAVGGLSLAGVLRPSPHRVVLAAGCFALGFAVTSVTPTLAAALVAVFAVGVVHVVFETMSSGSLQLFADPQMRGRVLSMWVLAASIPVGAPALGWLSGQDSRRSCPQRRTRRPLSLSPGAVPHPQRTPEAEAIWPASRWSSTTRRTSTWTNSTVP
jgi:hypothetical protein